MTYLMGDCETLASFNVILIYSDHHSSGLTQEETAQIFGERAALQGRPGELG